MADGANNVGQSHPRALAEVPELVCQDAGELPQAKSAYQRHADRQDQVASQKAEQSPAKAGRGVYLAVDVDAPGIRRTDGLANTLDERE